MIRAKKSLQDAAPYAPGRPIEEIKRNFGLSAVTKLASNENPLGTSPLAREAVLRAADKIFLYPDPDAFELRQALSAHLKTSPENLVFGTGSDGLIELICKTFLSEGDESIMPHPSFSLYELNVQSAGAVPVRVPLTDNKYYSPVDMLASITDKTRVIWLCNPNNPTGGMYTQAEQDAFLKAVPDDILVVIDEAYYEYACGEKDYPNSFETLKNHKNIIILRTFSKIYGLAGLRIGYGITHPAIAAELEKARPPFNVCLPAQEAAVAAISDSDFVSRSLKENKENKKYLEAAFDEMGLSYIKSATNFIAVDTGKDAKTVYEQLLSRGYIVKGGHVLGLPGYLRVTIGTKEECEGFVKTLKEVLKEL